MNQRLSYRDKLDVLHVSIGRIYTVYLTKSSCSRRGRELHPCCRARAGHLYPIPNKKVLPSASSPSVGVKNVGLRWEIHWQGGQQVMLHTLAGLCERTNSFKTAQEIQIPSYTWRNDGRKL